MEAPASKELWYQDGLRFACTQCGNCCSGSAGYVWVTKAEMEKIAAFIGRKRKGLSDEQIRRVGVRSSLAEDPQTGDCCFLKRQDGRRVCSIYPVRPLQCRTWPFWEGNLRTPQAWAAAAVECPGMNRGRLHDFVQITIRRQAKCWEDLPE